MRLVSVFLCALWLGAPSLSAQKKIHYAKELKGFFKDVDANYPFFKSKGIEKDWKKSKASLRKRAKACKDDVTFVMIVKEAIDKLRDGHASFRAVRPKMPRIEAEYFPGISLLPASKGRVVVMSTIKALAKDFPPGTLITKINGKGARAYLDAQSKAAWDRGGYFSSPQRARLIEYRLPFRGKQGESFKLQYRSKNRTRNKKLRATRKVGPWPKNYHLPEGLVALGDSIFHVALSKDLGYCWMTAMGAAAEENLKKVQAAHPKVGSWILDLRGNKGGGYAKSMKTTIRGFGTSVAVIVDAGSISAAETFARDLVEVCRGRLFGATTAGSSSTKRVFEFPSKVASVRYSVGARRGLKGKPIEFFGILSHERLEADPEDLAAGRNTEIEAAKKWLRSK
ncbi:MAG: S41 family peptidase [Planctomycetota bacterium]